mmetsp:Transcript_121628/g.315664  ORF Transcript_121628/g.315664 Transcript_121628/m.315664 type:complete len:202 (+) Transcript_121628:712-1317(+)
MASAKAFTSLAAATSSSSSPSALHPPSSHCCRVTPPSSAAASLPSPWWASPPPSILPLAHSRACNAAATSCSRSSTRAPRETVVCAYAADISEVSRHRASTCWRRKIVGNSTFSPEAKICLRLEDWSGTLPSATICRSSASIRAISLFAGEVGSTIAAAVAATAAVSDEATASEATTSSMLAAPSATAAAVPPVEAAAGKY